jgi:hypothetical protein
MREVLKWWLFWIMLCGALCLVGCESGTSHFHLFVQSDGGVRNAVDVGNAIDAQGVVMEDARFSPPLDAYFVTDAVRESAPDTTPACPTVTVQPPPAGTPADTRWGATVQATSTDGFCFKTCDTPIFGLTWKGFAGRTLTVNGTAVYLVGVDGKINSDTGATETVATPIGASGLRTFQVSAGSSATASFSWAGGSVACL